MENKEIIKKQCKKCNKILPLYHFEKFVGKWSKTKRIRIEKEKIYYKNKCKSCVEGRLVIPKEERTVYPKEDDNKKQIRRYYLMRNYGITLEQYNNIYEEQEGRCKICNIIPDEPHVDHCHSTGKVRAILCRGCNTGIGSFKENPELMLKAIEYLKQHK